jgi:hypothetical protein
MYLCDECGAKAVGDGESPPLMDVHGTGGIDWFKHECNRCKKVVACEWYPFFRWDKEGLTMCKDTVKTE